MTSYVLWYDPAKATGSNDGTTYADAYQTIQALRDGVNAISAPPPSSDLTINVVASDAVDSSLVGADDNGSPGNGSRMNAQANLTTIAVNVVDSSGVASADGAPWVVNYDDLSSETNWEQVNAVTYGFETDGGATSKIWRLQDNSAIADPTRNVDLMYFEKTAGTNLYDAAFADKSLFRTYNSTSGLPGKIRAFASNATYRGEDTTKYGQTWQPYADAQWASRDASTETITAVADDGSGNARFTTSNAHNFGVGETVTISGTTNYNGAVAVTNVTSATTFDTAQSYVSSQTGSALSEISNFVYSDGAPDTYYDRIYIAARKGCWNFYEWRDITILGRLRCKYAGFGVYIRHSNASEPVTLDIDMLSKDYSTFQHVFNCINIGRFSGNTTNVVGEVQNIGGDRCGGIYITHGEHYTGDELDVHHLESRGSGTGGTKSMGAVKLETNAEGDDANSTVTFHDIWAKDAPLDRNDYEPGGCVYFEQDAQLNFDCYNLYAENVTAPIMYNNDGGGANGPWKLRAENIVLKNVPHLMLITTKPNADSEIDIGYFRITLPDRGSWINYQGNTTNAHKIGASAIVSDASFNASKVSVHSGVIIAGAAGGGAYDKQYVWGGDPTNITFTDIYSSGLDAEIVAADGTTESGDAGITQPTINAVTGAGYPMAADAAAASTARWTRRDFRAIPHTGLARNAHEWTPLGPSATTNVK